MELPWLVHRILGIQPRWNVGCPMSKEVIISKVKGSAGLFHPDEIAINDRQIHNVLNKNVGLASSQDHLFQTQMLNVWHIYLHLVDLYAKCR